MSLADDIINGTYKQRGISINASKKETQTAPVKNVSEEIISGTYNKRNINTNLTSKSRTRLNTIKKRQERNLNQIVPIKDVVSRISNIGQSTTTGIKQGLLNKVISPVKDLANTGKNLALGASSGLKQTINYIENATENNFSNYRNNRKNQFYASNKVDGITKAQAKAQDSGMILKRAEQNMSEENKQNLEDLLNNKVETNLVKKSIQDSINKDNLKIQENAENTNSKIMKKINGEIVPSIGQMGVGTVISTVNPLLGAEYFMTSAGGSYIDDAKQRGMDDNQSFKYGTIMGGIEGLTEELGIENFKKAGKVAKSLIGGGTKTAIKEVSKQGIKEALKDYGIGIADNVMQEAIIEPIQELTAQTIGGKDKANWDGMGQRMLKSGFNGGLVSAIVGGADVGISSCVGVMNKINNGQQITQQEFETAVKDASKQFDVSKMIIDSTQQQIENYKNNIQPKAPTNSLANNNQSLYNISNLEETNNVPIDEVLSLQNGNGGYREEQSLANLREDIIQNGIKNPIELVRNKDGSIHIENGNHRLQIAKELGIKEVPIKFVESWDNIGRNINNQESNQIQEVKEEYARGNQNFKETNITNAPIRTNGRDSSINSNKFENRKTGTENDRLSRGVQEYNNRPSSNSTYEKNINEQSKIVPIKETSNEDSFNMPPINNNEDINPYRDTARANKLIKEKNNLIRQVETDMKQTTLPQAKSILNQRIQEIENDYNEKIQGLYDNVNRNQKQNEIETTEKNPTRHEIIQKNREVARENIKNISNWKDKKRGLSYQLETMERNMYDIIPDKAEAKKINETYFEPIHAQEAQKQKFINSYNDRIKQFNLNKYESEAVQLLGEQKYNPDFKADEVKEVLDRVNKNIENGKVDKQKVNDAIEEFRTIYDELFEQENKALRDNGYKEKPYRKGYFPHFIDYVPETKTEKLLNKLGFKIDKRPLPTDIAGITEQFVPGKTWNKSALERKTNKTDYNALKGFDTYIAQASDNIFHTENIQRLRGLENEIRYQYSDKGVQERIDNILNDETLYAEEKQDMINNIFEQVDNPMPNLVTELRRYTNALANKKSEADRSIENMIGRDVYSTVNAIENKFGANAVGLNIGSAFTNIIPITQAWSQVSTKNMSRAAIDTVKSYLTNDGFVDSSNFLTSRLNQSDKLYKTGIEKISDKSSFLFNAIDDVTSNIVVRGKYLENIEKGMSQAEAIKDADQFARNVMADRSKGALPTKFEEKNPITKAFTQFQLEVNNQYRYMFKDIPRDLAEKGLGSIALAFFKMFVGAWLYNEASERITGRRPAFDPIELIKLAYKDFTDEDKSTYDKLAGTIQNVGEELPFVGGLMGGGRIPVNGAIPSISNVAKAGTGLITGEMDSKKALNTLGKEFAKPAYYLVPPFGGAQLKKSIEGISTVKKGGSYGVDKEGKETLQFPVENPTASDYIKAGIFGKYAVPLAKDYTDRNYKSLNAKQTKAYKESNIPYKEYLTYVNQDFKKNADKINYINNQKWNDSQKWGIYTNEILSNKERDDGSSQLKDAQYAIKNGISKSEYMKLYNETNKRNMSMPTTKEMQKFQKQNLELKDYVNYQIKVHDKTALYRKSGQLDENEQLKNKDKMQLLLDSDYTNKQKISLYESCIKSKEKEDTISTYEIMKKAGLNINEWLKYSQQEFESDKEDDGTIKGKSVDGSKKQKVYSYINSANMNYEQRLLLLGTQYKLNNSERRTLVNYVNNMKADYSTRMKIFSKIKGVTVYKNGTIKF